MPVSLTDTDDVVFDYNSAPIFWLGVFFLISILIWVILLSWSPEWFNKSTSNKSKSEVDYPKLFIVSFLLGGIFTLIFWAVSWIC